MKIPYVDLKAQWKEEKKKLLPLIEKILSKAEHVGGTEIDKFEKKISNLCNVKHTVALNSGTDALTLGLHLLGVKPGDEVITPPNSFIASAASIVHLGAKPVFVDVKDDQLIDPGKIESAITKKTKAIMPVHLTGKMCEMKKITQISKKYNIPVIEDAAQSIGSRYMNRSAGSIGKIGCFSAHPLKNLNAFGDSGYLTTNDTKIASLAKILSNHGMVNRNIVKKFGYVSRMDNLQAGILNFHLTKLDKIIKSRRKNAQIYRNELKSDNVFIPRPDLNTFDTYHTFVVQVEQREKLIKYLQKNGVQTSIHYPNPIHLQPAAKYLGYKKGSFPVTESQSKKILTLPVNQFLKEKHLLYIIKCINKFYE